MDLKEFIKETINISGIAGFGSTSTLTIAGRVVFDLGSISSLDTIFGFFYGGFRITNVATRTMQLELLHDGYGTIVDGSYASSWDAGSGVMAFVLAIDTTAGLAGGNSVRLYINGSEAVTSTTTGIALSLDTENPLELMASGGGDRFFPGQSNGFWMSTSVLDPNTNWSNFFDGSNQWQSLPANGVISGVTPGFWQNGDAANWNSGTDNNGNSYTMNGAVG